MATINQVNNTLNDPVINDGDFNMPVITAPIISSGIFSGTINSSTINNSTINASISATVQNWDGIIKTTTNPLYSATNKIYWSNELYFGKFSIGDKVVLVQGGGNRYYYIIDVGEVSGLPSSSLTLTLIGDPSTPVLNQEIEAFYYSKSSSIATTSGFKHPIWFSYTPTLTGFSADPTNCVYKFKLDGNWCTTVVSQTSAGTSNATGFSITAPIRAKTVTNMIWTASLPYAINAGAASTTKDDVEIVSNGTAFVLSKNVSSTGWTNSGGKSAYFTISYEI